MMRENIARWISSCFSMGSRRGVALWSNYWKKEAIMRESFSFARFARLFIKHTAEHYRTYLMAMSVLVGFLVLCGVFLFFVIPFAPDPGFQTASYAIVMLVAGGLFTSTVFADYGDNRTA